MKMKFLKQVPIAASIVVLGAGLAVAQCSSATGTTSSMTSSASENDRTPSAVNPQTNSPDSVNRFNPVTGQNADSMRNPNAVPLGDHNRGTDATSNGQSATVSEDPNNSNSVIVTQESTSDDATAPSVITAASNDSGAQE